jgi:N6-adenosine-specific RNA methylase IME4
MTYDQIRNLRVAPLARPSSHLYLWATQRSLREAFSVIDAWGFDYKMTLTWCKKMGLGFHYFRHSSEFLLFAVRSCLATKQRNVGTWFQAPKGTHRQFAAKPDYSYQLIEDNSPGPYLELFARRRYSKKWDVWGDEIRSTVRLT